MLNPRTIDIVKATAPAVAAHAEAITRSFYTLMFAGNPEVRAFFNPAHQHSGGQQRALAGAICAYAANIDNLGALGPAVELIAQKHCSLNIKPEHYPIVGRHLLVAIKDVLGDAATDEIIAAWTEAYGLLADVLIERERAIYAEQAEQAGGWNGRRAFVVDRKVRESDIITSFYLRPQDGGPLPHHQPGQYVTVHVQDPKVPTTPRNYSLSDRPGLGHYRISVKREPGNPPGLISNYLHERVEAGDVLHLGPPCGEFTLGAEAASHPVVLISGGVGVTPMLAMLKSLAHAHVATPVHFVHGTRNSATHALDAEARAAAAALRNGHVHVRYNEPLPGDVESKRCDGVGLIDAALLKSLVPEFAHAQFYVCGPKPFMAALYRDMQRVGVAEAQVHFEFFGPKQDLVLAAAETPGATSVATLAN